MPASHPTGVRGLKSAVPAGEVARVVVAPHWGAWIEIQDRLPTRAEHEVAPHWGAWIEIWTYAHHAQNASVAPHWGAWIEIPCVAPSCFSYERRTPLGCVD